MTNAQGAASRRTDLLMVRHGVTPWNKEHRFQGHIDISLDAEGRAQARLLGERIAREHLAGERIAAVYSSDLARARETATAVADAIGLPLAFEPGLRERYYGAFEGLTHHDLERDYPEAFARWRARDVDFDLPGGGESLRRFHARIQGVLFDIARRHEGQRIVAVTHGGVLDSVSRIATGGPLEAPRRHELLNASVNRIAWDGEAFSLVHWADVEHLRSGASLDDDAASVSVQDAHGGAWR